MEHPVATKKIGDKTLKLFHDEDTQNPREDERASVMLYTSTRHVLGDKQVGSDQIDAIVENAYEPSPLGEVERLLGISKKKYLVLRTYAYIHSGTVMKASRDGNPFSCQWDSGCCGIIYMKLSDVKKEYGDLSPDSIEKALKRMESEVAYFSQWLAGECYGYKLEDAEGNEVDSCWGYIGDSDEVLEMLSKELAE